MGIGTLLDLVPELKQQLARFHIVPLREDGSVDTDIGQKGLPFWPETISDSKGSEWASKPIPGGSHPLYQWVQGTDRVISFSLVLLHESQDVDPLEDTEDIYNVDIPGAIAWLRSMEYPLYEEGAGIAKAPPTLILVFPGSHISGVENLHELYVIMTQCDVEYQSFFNDGTPRLATVQVSFNVMVQGEGNAVMFYGRDVFYETASRYWIDPMPKT